MVWLSPSERGGFTGTFREAEMCPGFHPPQAACVTVVSGEKWLWVIWYNNDVVRLRNKGIGRIQICVMDINIWWWALILSLRSGEGIGEVIPELVE